MRLFVCRTDKQQNAPYGVFMETIANFLTLLGLIWLAELIISDAIFLVESLFLIVGIKNVRKPNEKVRIFPKIYITLGVGLIISAGFILIWFFIYHRWLL